MLFHLVHEVGNRQRWRTKEALSHASAALVAEQISAIAGITGVSANPRTGSVIVTYDTAEARTALAEYLAGLAVNPPIRRAERAAFVSAPRRPVVLSPDEVVRRVVPTRAAQAIEVLSENRLVRGVSKAVRSGAANMPILSDVFYPVMRFLGFAGESMNGLISRVAPALTAPKAAASGGALQANNYKADDAELDFGPLARYVFLRPVLPFIANAANAFLGAVPIIREGFSELFKGHLNVAVLDASALIVSLLRRDFKTAGLLVLLLGMGEMLENYARKKSMASLAEQLSVKCDVVWVREGEELRQKPLTDVTPDDVIVVRSGSVIPVDGVVADGEAAVNQTAMTGEPLAVHRTAGGSVFAGTVVESGEIGIRPTGIGDGTRLSQIISFVEESEKVKAGIESKALKFADAIVPFNFALAAIVWFVTRDLTRTASVLLVDYSCALRLATPLAILSSMKEGTARGVVVKGGRYLEALAEVDTVVFDKTGTLTNATPCLSDVVSLREDMSEDELLTLSACLEEHFPHPVSRAIVRAAEERGLHHHDEQHDAEVKYVVAHGICSAVNGETVLLGSRHFIEDDEGVSCSEAVPHVERLAAEGKTVLYVALSGRLIGVLGIEDPIREEAAEVIDALHARGKKVVMLTGDDDRTAAAVAARLGIDAYRAQVLPSDKAEEVQRLKDAGARVLMIGDGINDSPALSAADVGVTMRDGTDIAQEVADVIMAPSLKYLLVALDMGEATMRRIRQNVCISVGLNSAFLAGGLTGILMPAVSALLHNATTIGVCLNAMRPELGHYDGETRYAAELQKDVADMFNRLGGVIRGNDAPTAGAPRVAVTALEAAGVA